MKPLLLATIFVGIGILAGISINVSAEKSNSSATISLSELLPQRDDVGTEWRIQEIEIDKKLDSAVEQLARRYIGGNPTETIITLYLYKFDSKDSAFRMFDGKVKEVYEKGGFKEYGAGLVGADKCYGSLRSYTQGDKGEVYCYKNNIYYVVDFRTIYTSIGEQPKNFASLVANKIGTSVYLDTRQSDALKAEKPAKTTDVTKTVKIDAKKPNIIKNDNFHKIASNILSQFGTDVAITGRIDDVNVNGNDPLYGVELLPVESPKKNYRVIVLDTKIAHQKGQCVIIEGKLEGILRADLPNVLVKANKITIINCNDVRKQ